MKFFLNYKWALHFNRWALFWVNFSFRKKIIWFIQISNILCFLLLLTYSPTVSNSSANNKRHNWANAIFDHFKYILICVICKYNCVIYFYCSTHIIYLHVTFMWYMKYVINILNDFLKNSMFGENLHKDSSLRIKWNHRENMFYNITILLVFICSHQY